MGYRDESALDKIARYVIKKLTVEGFRIHRYDSYTTNSIYLKFDNGVANSLRISDHRGKKHLKYMFNVVTARQGDAEVKTDGKYTRYYYNGSKEQLDLFLAKLLDHRENHIVYSGGSSQYLQQMTEAQDRGRRAKGFWSQAKVVAPGKLPTKTNLEHTHDVIDW